MRQKTFILGGGLDLKTPVLSLRPGDALAASNYELDQIAGYRRMKGYERFDGRPAPSKVINLEEREARRAAIDAVPGLGPVRGVFYLNGFRYAFRNAVDGMSLKLYKATPFGWQLVTTPALNPGGRLKWIRHNFNGNIGAFAVYGVTGTNKAFEFDGMTYTEITTGAEPQFPTTIAEFSEHLFLGYDTGSLQFSSPGLPLDYVVGNGAGEFAIGFKILGLVELIGGALSVFTNESIRLIQGTSSLDFVNKSFSDVGVRPNSVQPLFSDAVFLDKQIQRMGATQDFGDFQAGTLSEKVRPLVERFLMGPVISAVSSRKNQFMLFNDRREAIVASFNSGNLRGFTTYKLAHDFFDIYTTEGDAGLEEIYAAGEDGFVYKLDSGSSFDAVPIVSFLLLAPNHVDSYEQRKRFKKLVVESISAAVSSLSVYAEFDYGDSPRSLRSMLDTNQAGGQFDFSNWNEFTWSSDIRGYATAYIQGHGRNILVAIYNESLIDTEFTLQSISIGYDLRGPVR